MITAFVSTAYTGRKLEELEYITRFENDVPGIDLSKPVEKPSTSTIRRTA